MKRAFLFSYLALLVFVIALFCTPESTLSAERKGSTKDTRLTKPQGTPISTLVNINNLAMWIRADGWSARDPSSGASGVTFPRGTGTCIFQDGLVWGGLVEDGGSPTLRVGGQTYNIGTAEGAIISKGVAESPSDPSVRIYRIRRDYATADLRQDAAELNRVAISAVSDAQVEAVRSQYANDWNEWPVGKGAPFYDVNGNGVYEPGVYIDSNGNGKYDSSEPVEEPGIAGADQVVWFVANDLDEGLSRNLYGSPPIGMEMQVTLWGYARTDALGNVLFKQFKFIYKGTAATPPTAHIDSMYVAQWSDPDLGEYSDDYAGSDTLLSMGFVWNSTSVDPVYASYNLPSPSSGYDFFAGPTVSGGPDDVAIVDLKKRSGLRNLPMSSFVYFGAGSGISDPPFNYTGTEQWYNLLRGYLPTSPVTAPLPFTDPDGRPAKFSLNGDPVTGSGWIDGQTLNAGDRRIVLNSGPFKMALGDTQAVVVALLGGLGADNKSSVAVLKFNDRFAQDAFNNLFELPKAPPAPKVSATGFDGQVLLNWASDPAAVAATEGQDVGGYKFEGYNVYQLPTATATFAQAKKIATYDVVNETTTILAESFDIASGQILKLPVQLGKNTGISRFLTLDQDLFRDRPFVNGSTYYFVVTAYNVNPDPLASIPSLESSLQVLSVIPQSTKPGVRLSSKAGESLNVAHTGESDGGVEAIVVDPSKLTGHDYSVGFTTGENGENFWNLTDVTANKVVLSDQTNQSGDNDYLVVDGLQVKVSGPPLVGLSFSADPNSVRWVTGGDFDGDTFFGGAFLGPNFQGSSLAPGDYRTIRLDFFPFESYVDANGNGAYDSGEIYTVGQGDGQVANRYQTFSADAYLGLTTIPFRVFDVESDPPRQLAVVIRDRDQNGQWDLSIDDGSPFNYVYITDLDYDPTGNDWNPTAGGRNFMAELTGDGAPVQWVLWMRKRLEPVAAFSLTLVAPNVNTKDDVFTFKSLAPSSSTELAGQDVEKLVNVYPNPYYGFNRMEVNRYTRFITFTHMPQQATIRIFTLAGVLVKTIQKDDDTQYVQWDLQNQAGLPAASGIYLAHIDMPGLGKTKILKIALIQEQQFLQFY